MKRQTQRRNKETRKIQIHPLNSESHMWFKFKTLIFVHQIGKLKNKNRNKSAAFQPYLKNK